MWDDGFTYDGMGNVTSDGSNSYSYDAEGRPASAGGKSILYDAFNRMDVGRKGLALFKNPGVRAIVLNQAVQVGKQALPVVADILDAVPGVDAFAHCFKGLTAHIKGLRPLKNNSISVWQSKHHA